MVGLRGQAISGLHKGALGGVVLMKPPSTMSASEFIIRVMIDNSRVDLVVETVNDGAGYDVTFGAPQLNPHRIGHCAGSIPVRVDLDEFYMPAGNDVFRWNELTQRLLRK